MQYYLKKKHTHKYYDQEGYKKGNKWSNKALKLIVPSSISYNRLRGKQHNIYTPKKTHLSLKGKPFWPIEFAKWVAEDKIDIIFW